MHELSVNPVDKRTILCWTKRLPDPGNALDFGTSRDCTALTELNFIVTIAILYSRLH